MRQVVKLRKHSAPSRLRKRRKIIQISIGSLLVIALLYVANYFLRDPKFGISMVNINGSQTVSGDEIKSYVSNALSGNSLSVFPRNNKFTYPKKTIGNGLVDAFPRISSVGLSITDSNLNVEVLEHKEKYLYCLHDGKCRYVSEEGALFGPYITPTSSMLVRFISPLAYESKEEVKSFTTVATGLTNIGITARSIERTSSNDAIVRTEEGWQIKYDTKEDVTSVLKRLGLALSSESLPKEQWAMLEYIDLRFGAKVFYKFKQ